MAVRRIDTARLDKAQRTDEGFLRVPAHLTRTGVFEYQRADGSVQRELRLPKEVFDAASLASFDLKPLTRGHPNGRVDAASARALAVGVVAGPKKAADGEHVEATVMVYDGETIAAIDRGERELSNGYNTDLIPIEGGVYRGPDWPECKADFLQTNIRGNHTALVSAGRAGSSASVRLDSAGHAITDRSEERKDMDKDTEIAQLKKDLSEMKAKQDAADKARTDAEAKARADAAEVAAVKAKADAAELAKLQGERDALKADADRRAKADAERELTELRAKALPVLGVKADELAKDDHAAIVRKVVAKSYPTLSLDGRSDEYLRPLFDAAMAAAPAAKRDSAADIRSAAHAANGGGGGGAGGNTDPVAKLRNDFADAWKPKAQA